MIAVAVNGGPFQSGNRRMSRPARTSLEHSTSFSMPTSAPPMTSARKRPVCATVASQLNCRVRNMAVWPIRPDSRSGARRDIRWSLWDWRSQNQTESVDGRQGGPVQLPVLFSGLSAALLEASGRKRAALDMLCRRVRSGWLEIVVGKAAVELAAWLKEEALSN